MQLWQKVLIGLVLGVLFGIYYPEYVGYVQPIGTLFITLIRMIIVPLIFFTVIVGISGVADAKTLGRIGIKACTTYLLTTSFAIFMGIAVGTWLAPGTNLDLGLPATTEPDLTPDLLQVFLNIVPHNGLAALVEGNILQVVFFAIFVGVSIVLMGPEGRKLNDMARLISQMIFKMVGLIMECAPFGAFALTAYVVGTQGMEVLQGLLKLMGTISVAFLIQFTLFGVLIRLFGKLSPWPFYKKSLEYQLLALATSSSKATLATTMEVCQQKLGVSRNSTSFILPLGATINMDGVSIYLGITAVFFAQACGITLTLQDYMMIMLTATLGSIGAAGIPGGSLMMLPMVLSAVHLPIEGVALIAGIDRILDMLRTMINITGDATVTVVIDASEKKLNKDIYYS